MKRKICLEKAVALLSVPVIAMIFLPSLVAVWSGKMNFPTTQSMSCSRNHCVCSWRWPEYARHHRWRRKSYHADRKQQLRLYQRILFWTKNGASREYPPALPAGQSRVCGAKSDDLLCFVRTRWSTHNRCISRWYRYVFCTLYLFRASCCLKR